MPDLRALLALVRFWGSTREAGRLYWPDIGFGERSLSRVVLTKRASEADHQTPEECSKPLDR